MLAMKSWSIQSSSLVAVACLPPAALLPRGIPEKGWLLMAAVWLQHHHTMSVGVIRGPRSRSRALCSMVEQRAPSLVWPNSLAQGGAPRR